jgi:hypothetical protein
VGGIIVVLYTQGLNSQTLLFGYFQYFSILFMFLSSLFRPIIFSKIYIFKVEVKSVLRIGSAHNVPINSKLQHPPPGISLEFDFKSSPGSKEFDVLSLPCGGAVDKGGEFEPEVLKFCPFSRASCMHRKDFASAAYTVFSDFEGNGLNLVITWLKGTGMEKLCASFEGMHYKIV